MYSYYFNEELLSEVDKYLYYYDEPIIIDDDIDYRFIEEEEKELKNLIKKEMR